MIRIDEIYYNIFVSALQHQSQIALHWFDPFGSTEFDDIVCSAHINNKKNDAKRILLWDQEPLHYNRINPVMKKFVSVYDGKIILITSEQNSEYVKTVCDTYNLIPEYYFFHGWAALDWFRGYDKTFLIKPSEQRQPTKTFITPNRIIAGKRQHRLEMLYWIFKLGLINNYISCPIICPAENISIFDSIKELPFNDTNDIFQTAKLPMQFEGEIDHPMHSYKLSLFDQSADSLLYLVTETVADGRRLHLTEKTFKPIALGMPFVLVATAGSLEYLRSYGFKTFGHLWDEGYDDILDPHERIRSVASLLQTLDNLSPEARINLWQDALPTIEHNYRHFYNGGFEAVLWDELQGMLNRVKSSL